MVVWKRGISLAAQLGGFIIGALAVIFGLVLLSREFLINENQLCGRVLDVAIFGAGRASGGENSKPDPAWLTSCTTEAWWLVALAAIPILLGLYLSTWTASLLRRKK